VTTAVAIFAKAPVPGSVKTRLLPVLSPGRAAALHARLTYDLTAGLARSGTGRLYLYGHPGTDHPFFHSLRRRFGVVLRPQRGRDLGERMLNAARETLALHSRMLLVGCDCPLLTPALCRKALAALEGNDVVLGPAEDGGYVLIGLRRPIRELFDDLAWGTETVLAETRRRIRALGLRSHELPLLWDLDRPSDLVRYRRHQRSTTCKCR